MKGGDKELVEKLGRKDPCPCGSGKSFQEMLPQIGALSMGPTVTSIGGTNPGRIDSVSAAHPDDR
ncbi:MAG: SEC-C metal-binding domain-containing protein [Pseudomonadota bacterium]